MALYSPNNCNKHSHKIRTVKDVLNLPSKTLGDFKRDYGRDWVIAYVSMWLIDLVDNANVKQKMNDAQIEFTAERIFDSYSLKITDLTLFFRNVKEGVYGSYYENLSQDKIMNWLSQYFDLRCEYAQMYAANKHEKFSVNKDKMHPEIIKEMFKDVGNEEVKQPTGNGLGTRVFKQDLIDKIKTQTTDQLKDYLAKTDFNSTGYNETIYKLVETEIDFRNKKNTP